MFLSFTELRRASIPRQLIVKLHIDWMKPARTVLVCHLPLLMLSGRFLQITQQISDSDFKQKSSSHTGTATVSAGCYHFCFPYWPEKMPLIMILQWKRLTWNLNSLFRVKLCFKFIWRSFWSFSCLKSLNQSFFLTQKSFSVYSDVSCPFLAAETKNISVETVVIGWLICLCWL